MTGSATEMQFDHELQAWLVKDVATARSVLTDDSRFSIEAYRSAGTDLSDIRRFILAPPGRHRQLRHAMARASSGARLRRLDSDVLTPCAEALAAQLPTYTQVDLQARFVAPYTRQAMFGLIGLDDRTGDELVAAFRVAHRLIREQGDLERGVAALRWLRARAAQACADTTTPRGPASILDLAHREAWLAGGLDIDDIVCFMMSLIEAVATKSHRDLTASLLRRIAAMPEAEQDRLASSGSFIRAAEEAVRLQRDLALPRRAIKETTLHGRTIKPGDLILVMLEDVGRDSSVFEIPEQFQPFRGNLRQSVAFGLGKHRCVSENTAKLIAACAARVLLCHFSLAMRAQTPTNFTVTLEPRS